VFPVSIELANAKDLVMSSASSRLAIACVLLGALGTLPAAAQETAQPPAAPDTGLFAASPVDADTLATYRGGAQVRNSMDLNGTTDHNSAYEVTTGTNTVGGGSFANMSGLPIVIQNSGANVLIQNAVILNVQMD
jgi:hypothetical protein